MNNLADKFFESIKGKKVGFIGIGTSNLPLIKLFSDKGAVVSAYDKKDFESLGENAVKAKEYGAELVLGEDYLSKLDGDIIFRSPGTPFYRPELVALREKGVVLTSEMEVFFDLCPCKIIAITGSDGKTTTTTIISEFLKASGVNVHLGGNIGKPLLPEIESIKEDDVAVVELSSFQLISMRKSPDVAVVTNLAPNHLDIHKDMQEYVDSKKNIVLHQNAFSKAVLNLDNEIANSFSDSVRGQLAKFSVKEMALILTVQLFATATTARLQRLWTSKILKFRVCTMLKTILPLFPLYGEWLILKLLRLLQRLSAVLNTERSL